MVSLLILASYYYNAWGGKNGSDASSYSISLPHSVVPTKLVQRAAIAVASVAAGAVLLGVFWQHIASAAATTLYEAATYGTVSGSVGVAAAALSWVAVFLQLLALVGACAISFTATVLFES